MAAINILEKITNIGGKYLKEYFRATKVLDHKTIAITNAIKGASFFILNLRFFNQKEPFIPFLNLFKEFFDQR
jgi:hypothetical protein